MCPMKRKTPEGRSDERGGWASSLLQPVLGIAAALGFVAAIACLVLFVAFA